MLLDYIIAPELWSAACLSGLQNATWMYPCATNSCEASLTPFTCQQNSSIVRKHYSLSTIYISTNPSSNWSSIKLLSVNLTSNRQSRNHVGVSISLGLIHRNAAPNLQIKVKREFVECIGPPSTVLTAAGGGLWACLHIGAARPKPIGSAKLNDAGKANCTEQEISLDAAINLWFPRWRSSKVNANQPNAGLSWPKWLQPADYTVQVFTLLSLRFYYIEEELKRG